MVLNFLQPPPTEALKTLIADSAHQYFIQMLRACSKHQQYQFAIKHHLHLIMIHLPLGEITKMVNELIGLGFYRDHRANLNLIESLYIRKLSHPETSNLLTPLQNMLLQRSIEFHQKHHPRVCDKLQKTNIDMLFSDEGDNIVYTAPVVDTPPPAISEEHLFFSPQIQHDGLQRPDGTPNMQAYYTSAHVNQLLETILKNKLDIRILAALDFHQAPADNTLRQQLLEYIGEPHIPEPHHFIIPICIHQHWVAIRVQVKATEIEVTYYDSLPGQALRERIIGPAQAALNDIYNRPMVTRETRQYQQEDNYSCGAYLIENIRLDIMEGILNKNTNAKNLRLKHLDTLHVITENQADAHQDKRRKFGS